MIVFFTPEMGGYFLEYNNFIPADPLKTPEHIAPVWYFTPVLRDAARGAADLRLAVPGVAVMGAATLIFFVLPWLDRGKVKSIRYRGPKYRAWFTLVHHFLPDAGLPRRRTDHGVGRVRQGLPLVGGDYVALWAARVLTVVYFLFFLLMPWYTATDKEKPEPQRVTW